MREKKKEKKKRRVFPPHWFRLNNKFLLVN